jgi:hypothetical protein
MTENCQLKFEFIEWNIGRFKIIKVFFLYQ